MNKFFFPYHLVSISPWPLLGSFSLIIFMMGLIKLIYLSFYNLLFLGYILLMMIMIQWWRDIIRESTFQGNHTFKVVMGLRVGMILFILSEVMFFLSFFWCYFYMFLSPSMEIGMLWPPKDIFVFNPYFMPLFNTLVLLSSGVSITWCHYSILNKNLFDSKISSMLTVFLGVVFICFQYMEYNDSYFSICDSVYGSVFFMMTGFHGFHVILGILFILVSSYRIYMIHYSSLHHFGFEAASWYWHFVDVVWLFLYIFIYLLSY